MVAPPAGGEVTGPDRIDCARPPGAPLVCGADAGGVRWFLEDRPVHAGTGLELLTEIDGAPCDCDGDGCALCGGRCWRYSPLWLRVRFESGAGEDRGPIGWLHLPVHGADARVLVGPSMRCRWPAR